MIFFVHQFDVLVQIFLRRKKLVANGAVQEDDVLVGRGRRLGGRRDIVVRLGFYGGVVFDVYFVSFVGSVRVVLLTT